MNISVALQGRSCTLAQLRVLRSDDQASLPWGRGGGVPWVPLQLCPVTHLPSGPTHSTPGIIRADKELGALKAGTRMDEAGGHESSLEGALVWLGPSPCVSLIG